MQSKPNQVVRYITNQTIKSSTRRESYLKSHNRGRLKTEISLEVLGDFTDKSLEWELADQQLSRLLVATDLSESDGAGAITMGLLDSSGCWCGFPGSFRGQLLPGSLSSSGLSGSLLCSGHFEREKMYRVISHVKEQRKPEL